MPFENDFNLAETQLRSETPTDRPEEPTAASVRAPRLIEGSAPRLGDETLALLRIRLRSASLILSIGFLSFLAHRIAKRPRNTQKTRKERDGTWDVSCGM